MDAGIHRTRRNSVRQDTKQTNRDLFLDFEEFPPVGPPQIREGRDFLNAIDFPLGILSERTEEDIDSTEHGKTATFYGNSGQSFRLIGSSAYGLPTLWEESLLIAMLEIAADQGVFRPERMSDPDTNGVVNFTRYNLADRMQLTRTAALYAQIYRGLMRLNTTTYEAKQCFFDPRTKICGDATFHVFESTLLFDERLVKGNDGPASHVTLSRKLMADVDKGYMLSVDSGIYFGLKTPIARRIFRIINKRRMDRKPRWEIGLRQFAHERLGIPRKNAPSRVKTYLEKPLEELRNAKVISDVFYEDMVSQEGEKIVFRFTGNAPGESGDTAHGEDRRPVVIPSRPQITANTASQTTSQKLVTDPSHANLLSDLRSAGLSRTDAERVASNYPDEAQVQMLYMPYHFTEYANQGKSIVNPGKFLIQAIERGYGAPPAYEIAKLEEQRRIEKANAAEVRRKASITAEETRTAKEAQIDAYLNSLSPDALAAFDAAIPGSARIPSTLVLQRMRRKATKDALGLN